MGYCPKCGTQVADGTSFCPNCGTSVGANQEARPVIQEVNGAAGRLHCPKCKGASITPIIETVGTTGSAGMVTKNIALGTSKNINQSSWMCHSCGYKFRNIQELEGEIKNYERMGRKLNILTACLTVGFIFIIVMLSALDETFIWITIGPLLFLLFILLLVAVIACIQNKKTKKDKLGEYVYLKENCFD